MDPESMEPPPKDDYVEEENGHSLPNLEDMRTEAAIHDAVGGKANKHSGKSKRQALFLSISTVVLVLIIGFSIAISQNKKVNPLDEFQASEFSQREVSRFTKVQEFIEIEISDKEAFDDTESPQYKAAYWIADEDPANVALPSEADARKYDKTFEFVQRYILAVFFFATGGENWSERSKFLSEAHVCDWHFGLTASEPPAGATEANWKYGVQCNDDKAVTHIFMTNNNLTGELPKELGDLLDLYHLSLFKNNLSGGFPHRMSFLTEMKYLALESCGLSGPLPTWFNRWTKLKYVALGDNKFTGAIPSLVGMDQLRELALDENELTGGIDQLDDATQLRDVFLNKNKLSGRIHSSTMRHDHLTILDMSNNFLTGYFPVHFYGLESVDLHNNQLHEKSLPEVDISDSPLKFLSMYSNNIKGSIPATISSLSNLEHLDLSDNELTGVMPDALGDLKNLLSLYLSKNPFTAGTIPHMRDLSNLQELSLTQTNLVGNIHSWVGDGLKSLILLDLHDNFLTGSIPVNFSALSDLKLLFLNRNKLAGDVPAGLGSMSNLISIYLDNNSLTGNLQPVCDAKPAQLAYFIADCVVTCACCTECCDAADASCNNSLELDRLNNKIIRDQYLFSEDLIFKNN